jgi:hypothetical protein
MYILKLLYTGRIVFLLVSLHIAGILLLAPVDETEYSTNFTVKILAHRNGRKKQEILILSKKSINIETRRSTTPEKRVILSHNSNPPWNLGLLSISRLYWVFWSP